MTKKQLLTLGISFALILSVSIFLTKLFKSDNSYSLKLIEVDGGWGYIILKNQKTYIYQPYIPVFEGCQAFPDKQSANSVGELVIQKLKKNMNPAVSRNELIDLHIYDNPQ